MITVEMPLLDAKRMAHALLPHVPKDDVSSVLSHACIRGGETPSGFATDRYTVGRYDLTNVVTDPVSEQLLVPYEALSALSRVGPKALPTIHEKYVAIFRSSTSPSGMEQFSLQLAWVGGEFREVHWMRAWEVSRSVGNFPKVETLFDAFTAGERLSVLTNSKSLDKFSRYAKVVGENIRITNAVRPKESKKDSPFLVEIGARFSALCSPVLDFDRGPSSD